MLPPTIPVDKVATAILALNLGKRSAYWTFLRTIQWSYQKVQAFQTRVVLLSLSSLVTLLIHPASLDSFFAQAFKPLRIVPLDTESVLSEDLSAKSCLFDIHLGPYCSADLGSGMVFEISSMS
jgi:hypothetical protein